MTRAARTVLADCEIALELLEDQEDEGRWRVHWVGAIALIRAVGTSSIRWTGTILSSGRSPGQPSDAGSRMIRDTPSSEILLMLSGTTF